MVADNVQKEQKRNRAVMLIASIENLWALYMGMVNLFGLIFLYELFDQNILHAVLPFAVGHLVYAVLIKSCAKFTGQIGIRNSLIIAFLIHAVNIVPVLLFLRTQNVNYIFIWFALFYLGKLFYHIPINYGLGMNTSHKSRSADIAILVMLGILTKITVPIIGGLVSTEFGLEAIYILGSAIMILAMIPATLVSNEKFEVEINVSKWLSSSRAKEIIQFNFMRSITNNSSGKLYAILIYLTLSKDIQTLWILIALTTGLSIAVIRMVSGYMEKHRKSALKFSFVYEGLVQLALGIFINIVPISVLDFSSRLSGQIKEHTQTVSNFDLLNDEVASQHRDELVVLSEIVIDTSIAIGLLFFGSVAEFVSLQAAFVMIGLWVLASSMPNYLYKGKE